MHTRARRRISQLVHWTYSTIFLKKLSNEHVSAASHTYIILYLFIPMCNGVTNLVQSFHTKCSSKMMNSWLPSLCLNNHYSVWILLLCKSMLWILCCEYVFKFTYTSVGHEWKTVAKMSNSLELCDYNISKWGNQYVG